MPKNLSANQIANLTGQAYIKDYLVEITRSDGVTLWWTDSPFSFDRATDTSGGTQTFQPNKIMGISNIEYRSFLTDTKVSILVNDDLSLVSALGKNYETMTVRIYIQFRDPTDHSIDTSANPIGIFDGNVVAINSNFDNERNEIQIDCSKLLVYAEARPKIAKYTSGLISNDFGAK